jgi:lysozyme family protein
MAPQYMHGGASFQINGIHICRPAHRQSWTRTFSITARVVAWSGIFANGEAVRPNFEAAVGHILAFEGGYVDHPDDPGGATNLGITRETLARFRGRAVSKAEVRALDRATAAEIYQRFYWDALRCDAMPAGIDFALFDCGVNQGTGRATRLLQAALRVDVDGIIGPITLAAATKAERKALLNEFMARRMRAYGRLSRLFRTFGLGWSRRLMSAHSLAQAMIAAERASPKEPAGRPSGEGWQSKTEREDGLMHFLIDRLREPSTYAGVAAFLAGIGVFGLSEHEWNQIFGAVASVAGVAAMLMSDSPGAQPPAKKGTPSAGETDRGVG